MERLGLDFFRGDLPTCAGLSSQQLVAVGVLVALGVIGVCNAGQRRPPRRRRYGKGSCNFMNFLVRIFLARVLSCC